LKFDLKGYQSLSVPVTIDSYLQGAPHIIYVPLHVVKLEYMKHEALHRFMVADVISYLPQEKTSGYFSKEGEKGENGKAKMVTWTSDDDGLVELGKASGLKEGLIDITIPRSGKYQETKDKLSIAHKVYKGASAYLNIGRPLLLVPKGD